jgi:thioredoxin 2
MNDGTIVRCSQCGTRNRIPLNRQGEQGICGKCGAQLPLAQPYPNRPIDVSDLNFALEVKAFTGPVLVEFTAPW